METKVGRGSSVGRNLEIRRRRGGDVDVEEEEGRDESSAGEILAWANIPAGNARISARRRRLRVDDYLPRSLDRGILRGA